MLDANDSKIREMHEDVVDDTAERRKRHDQFMEIAEKLIAEAGYPLKTVADHFDNAEVLKTDDLGGFHARCFFDHTDRFPASVELRFDITHDDDMRQLILTKTLRILPVFMEYERTARFVLDLGNGDWDKGVQWIQDQMVLFVETYLKIQFVPQYDAKV
jgi:hypothetical protein